MLLTVDNVAVLAVSRLQKVDSGQTLQRLLAISWQFDDSRVADHVPLMELYLHRAARWAKLLECTELWPFFDIALQIIPTVRAPAEAVMQLGSHLEAHDVPYVIRRTCVWCLHWSTISDAEQVMRLGLPDPYDPLVMMYEHGGWFTREHGYINIGMAGLYIGKNWRAYESL